MNAQTLQTKLQNSSPTLLGEMKKQNQKNFIASHSIFSSKEIALCVCAICTDNQGTVNEVMLSLSELPEELRQGFHDYATRLCSEKHLIEHEMENRKTTKEAV